MKYQTSQPILQEGPAPETADSILLLLHGRGGSGEDMLGFGRELTRQNRGVCVLAPNAAGGTWYPQRFLAPLEYNEPYLSSALGLVADILAGLDARGVRRENVVLGGFSQGACLALEYAVRHPHRYGGIIALSGAIIGPPGQPRSLAGSLAGTPAFVGCGDHDTHIPLPSVHESADVLRKLGAEMTLKIYPGWPHRINADEVAAASTLLARVAGTRRSAKATAAQSSRAPS